MPFVGVTRLRVRAVRFLPAFALHAIRTRRQAAGAPGFLAGALLADRGLAFWTATVWTDRQSMRGYVASGAHRAAMPRFAGWCDEGSVVQWEQPDGALPTWPEADRRMRADGRPSRLRHPGPRHADMSFPPPRPGPAAPIRPAVPASRGDGRP